MASVLWRSPWVYLATVKSSKTWDNRRQMVVKCLPPRYMACFPTSKTYKDMTPAVLRGTALGCMLGILPGGGHVLSSFASYAFEKTVKMKPGEIPFGKGNIRGVAGPESANNAGAQTSFIPLLTLGIPSTR